MALWDGFTTDHNARVMVLAATNRPSELDEEKVTENSRKAATAAVTSQNATAQSTGTRADGSKKVSAGNFIKGAESALKLEERRSQIYIEVAAEIETLGLHENKVNRDPISSEMLKMCQQLECLQAELCARGGGASSNECQGSSQGAAAYGQQ